MTPAASHATLPRHAGPGTASAAPSSAPGRAPDAAIAVELNSVSKRFGATPAVENISLRVRNNEFISLIGPSGCGKTTVLRMIGGFERPTSGSIHLMGQPVDHLPPYRRATNMVFQHLALFPHLSVFDNVAFGPRLKGVRRDALSTAVRQALALVRLEEYGTRRVGQLSGGQRQRVAIARALVNEPAVLLLDEPFSALDAALRVEMQSEIKDIQRRIGTTFVYVTHDQTEAMTMSDRIAVLRNGQLEQIGSAREIYETPKTRFVARFLGDSNILETTALGNDANSSALRLADATIHAKPDPRARNGETVHLSIRPERIALLAEGRAASAAFDSGLAGQIRRVTFKGPLVEYTIGLNAGATLLALASSTNAPFLEGQRVTCAWRATDAVIVDA